MRKTLVLLALIIILGMVYYVTQSKKANNEGTIRIEDREFIVSSGDQIAVLTVKNPGYPMMHFAKQKDGRWILNDKYYTDPNIIANMTGVLQKMQIKYIPPQSMMPKIMGELDQVGIEIKSYSESGALLSDFIMGSNDNRELSTFCVKRGSQKAYAMHVAVAEGGLRNYFTQTAKDLRDKSLMNVDAKNIVELKVQYHKDRSNSFVIRKEASGYQLEALEKMNTIEGRTNQNTIKSYLLEYDKVVAEAIRTGEVAADSIKNLIPFATISYTVNDSPQSSYQFYPLKDLLVEEVNTQSYKDLKQIERYFVFDNLGDVYIVQQWMVGPYFKPIDYFLK